MAAAHGGYTVRVTGLREVQHALQRVDGDTRLALVGGLMKAADPVAMDTRRRLSRFQGISLGTIVPRAVINGVYITQKAKKVTGLRGDFGSLQMRIGLIPATEAGQDKFVVGVDAALGVLISREGFG